MKYRVVEEKEIDEIKKNIDKIIKDNDKAVEQLLYFDVRDAVFRKVVSENKGREDLEEDFHIYLENDDVVIRTCIGKKWAPKNRLDYDYDNSLLSSYIFCKTTFFGEEWEMGYSNKNNKYECMICCGEKSFYRGDTMNSWKRTLVEFFRLFGGGEDGYLEHLVVNRNRGKNFGKWRIAENDTSENWEDFLIKQGNYKKALPAYITEFMDVVYTMGNFISVSKHFNKGRASLTNDYWDLTLMAIYDYYMGWGGVSILSSLFDEEEISSWLVTIQYP